MIKSIHDIQLSIIKATTLNCHASFAFVDRENGVTKIRIFPLGPFAGDSPLVLFVSDNGCSLHFKLFGRQTILVGVAGAVAGIKHRTEAQ